MQIKVLETVLKRIQTRCNDNIVREAIPNVNDTIEKEMLVLIVFTRASNRLKYRSGLGSGSTKFIFSGLPPVQVFRRLILRV